MMKGSFQAIRPGANGLKDRMEGTPTPQLIRAFRAPLEVWGVISSIEPAGDILKRIMAEAEDILRSRPQSMLVDRALPADEIQRTSLNVAVGTGWTQRIVWLQGGGFLAEGFQVSMLRSCASLTRYQGRGES